MLKQKEVVSFLDMAAARAHSVNAAPATGKQCWFLASLIVKAEDESTYSDIVCNTSYVLTKKRASSMISDYLN